MNPTDVDTEGLPDFIIIGAQKSGTSSLHGILARHPGVFIPPREIFFFDVDDVEQHPDFFVRTGDGWTDHDFERDLAAYLAWYRGMFEDARPGQMIGEDSTTYLASRAAPGRIAAMLPEVKLIALLRDPVTRAYSHYWHTVSTGRATMTFEESLQAGRGNLITRGRYLEQIERYLAHFGSGSLKIILFEEFVSDEQSTVDGVCAFLGLEPSIDLATVDPHKNRASPPLSLPARLLVNRLFQRFTAKSYRGRIPNMPSYDPGSLRSRIEKHPLARRLADGYESLRPRRRYPAMKPETRSHLEGVFRRLNAGLSELIGRDVSEHWPYMSG
ncbi:MAG: sulfotransferase [Deltaproteobacteria bacterium]|nr:sulfotransferase [Deltaproteobacteria bacterium]